MDDSSRRLSNRHSKTLKAIFETPTRVNIRWRDIVALLRALEADVDEGRAGSRVGVILNGIPSTFHKPHPGDETPMLTVRDVRDFLTSAGVAP